MAVTAKTQKITAVILLDNGTTSSGAVRTISQTLGAIDKENYDPDKAYAIAMLVEPCLSKSVYAVQQTTAAYLEE